MSPSEELVIAGGEVVKRGIFYNKPAVAHTILNSDDGMARCTRQTGLSFGGMDLLLNGFLEPSIEKHSVIVAAGTPFGRLNARDVLHVFDGFPVPLIVEGREMM